MSLDQESSGALAVWAAQTPARGSAAPVRPARYRGAHRGRHRRGQQTNTGRWIVADPVGPDYNPLTAADRAALAPTHWDAEDRYLPAGSDGRTAAWDPAVIRAAAGVEPAPTGEVLAELRQDLELTRVDLSDPEGDADRIWRQVAGSEPPTLAADDTQQIGPVQ